MIILVVPKISTIESGTDYRELLAVLDQLNWNLALDLYTAITTVSWYGQPTSLDFLAEQHSQLR
jgi:hypothetical protein